jgi:hypothetical protein
MKKIIILLAVVGMFGFQGCEGPEGPQGPPGQDGLIADVFEITKISFTSGNQFSIFYTFPKPIYISDKVLVYRLSAADASGADVWRLIPENHFYPNGTLYFGYDFDFTYKDVKIFMVGNNLETVSTDFISNQIFRIVVVPAALINGVNANDYKAVINALSVKENQIQKIDIQ